MIEFPDAPKGLSERANRIRRTVFDRLLQAGLWDAAFTTGLNGLAWAVDEYLKRAALAEGSPEDGDLAAQRDEARAVARACLADFLMIEWLVDESGLDAEISMLASVDCGPPQAKE